MVSRCAYSPKGGRSGHVGGVSIIRFMNARNRFRLLFALSLVAALTFVSAGPVSALAQCCQAEAAQIYDARCDTHGTCGHGQDLSVCCGGVCTAPAISAAPLIPTRAPQDRSYARGLPVSPVLQWLEPTDTPPPRR